MSKTHLYFMPGLAAGPEIFDNLTFDASLYELHYLSWKPPLNMEETLTNYASRMVGEVKHKNPVLIGVSFGGILVQEMNKFIDTKRVIIISSVKSTDEMPTSYKFASKSKIYKLFPTNLVTNFDNYSKFFIGKSLEKKAKMYKKYLSVREEEYLKWSIKNVVNWRQEKPIENMVHLHGTKDNIFPIKNIKNCIKIENGNHSMIILKANEISKLIHQSLAC